MNSAVSQLKQRARQLKADTHALFLAYRDPRVPWYAKVVVACIVGYALSPIDPVPDFIPIFGYLDELIIIPAGITLALRLIPSQVMQECRDKARLELERHGKSKNWVAAGLIVLAWISVAAWGIWSLVRLWRS